MDSEKIELVRPDARLKDSFLAGLTELANHSERAAWVYLGDSADLGTPARDFGEYVATLLRRETHAPPGFVRDTVYWAVYENEMIGRIALRHELTEHLRKVGGHVGYIVRPSWRGRGVATEMLRLLIRTDRAMAIGRLLLTCDEGNVASERTILKNGGLLENIEDLGPDRPRKKRFWIDATKRY